MSGFTALNVEPEDNFEDEIDDTREIQLEEAFKLYQNALKLHSQGPRFYPEAQEAYDELFRSEVFKYPEAISEFAHDELDDEGAAAASQADSAALALLPTNAAESSASSIPQLLYLAFKNRGQFRLDVVHHNMSKQSALDADKPHTHAQPSKDSLRELAQALERDDTDLDLWKKSARIAEVLSSHRIARFCLESVLAGEDEDGQQTVDLSGLDEAYAAGELAEVIDVLQDDLSREQNAKLQPKPKSILLAALQDSNDPYPFLPKRSKTLEYVNDKCRPMSFSVPRHELKPESDNLFSLGEKIAEHIKEIHTGSDTPSSCATSGTIVTVALSQPDLQHHDIDMITKPNETTTETHQEELDPQNDNLEIDPSAAMNGMTIDPLEEVSVEEEGNQPVQHDDVGVPVDNDTIEVRTSVPVKHEPASVLPVKRSSTAAGNDEPEGRTKSKRLRARESMVDLANQDDEIVQEQPQFYLDLLTPCDQSDQAMFDKVNALLTKLDTKLRLSAEQAKQIFWSTTNEGHQAPESTAAIKDHHLLADLQQALATWTEEKSQAINQTRKNQDFPEKAAGISRYLHHPKLASPKKARQSDDSIDHAFISLVSLINEEPTNIYDSAIFWLTSVLTSCRQNGRIWPSPYLKEVWPAETKMTVANLAGDLEDILCQCLTQRLAALNQVRQEHRESSSPAIQGAFELVEGVFEVYLDFTSTVSDPNSKTDTKTRILWIDRLKRWATLTGDFMQLYLTVCDKGMSDPLILRFVWASLTHARLDQNIEKQHVVLLLEELRAFMEKSEAETLRLPNNTAMPEISVESIEHQLSVLRTSDFFSKVFDDDNSDPVAVIELLEPILDSMIQSQNASCSVVRMVQAEELVNFLESNGPALTVALWRRLQNAYISISYVPKVISCHFRMIEIIVAELHTSRHLDLDGSARQLEMLKWLHDVDEIMGKLVSRMSVEANPFECFDEPHLYSSLQAMSTIIDFAQGFALYDDSVRVGQTAGPQLKNATSIKNFEKAKDRLREMLVRAWYLEYLLLKEATVQDSSSFPQAADDLAELLCAVHNSLGVRQYCKYASKFFVKLVKNELSSLPTKNDYAVEMAQIFYDLYQLRFAAGMGDDDHGCPSETLDKKTAWSLIPTIMSHAERVNVKDLGKSELRGTIEKMQQALGVVKSSPALQQNRLVIRDYLKGVVKATDLFDCIKGILTLSTRPVKAETNVAATSGWYFMLGHLTLAKYKSVKRVSPTSTEELDQAMTFFRQDLNHDAEKWETWYRLAQCFEAKIEDDLIWNSAKLNDSRTDIALLERQAIHSYMMATAISFRTVDDRPEVTAKIEDMLGEFATRLYASSRAPLDMEAFKTDKHLRHLSSTADQTMSKQPFYEPVRQFTLWNFAARLLSMKLTERSKPWTSHYTRAKCLWKILQTPENHGRVTARKVIATIVEAIEALPKKEKTNEPVLEPHLKLVSVVHKMLRQGKISQSQAYQYMQSTRYAHGVNLSQDEDGVDWERYMIDILKKLSHADKANWHHRITNRSAHVLYDDSPNLAGALGAKHEFTQQIFTKTMTMQVWKPEHERPGRHYVYTGRYVLFFIHLLEQLNDRASLDSLVRRIRRKTTDFLDHTTIWEQATTAYVRLLRRHGQMPDGKERALFDGMNHEEFTRKSEAMEQWSHDPDTTSVYLDVMREGVELKRLNNSLMKGSAIDDLVGDAYACLYEEYVRQLPPDQQPLPQPAPLPQGTFINMTTDVASDEAREAQRARLDDTLRTDDAASSGPPSFSVPPAVGLGLQTAPSPLPSVPGQPVPEVQRERAKPGRVKTVTRREIQRKAESAIVKPPPIKTPILSKRPTIEISLKVDGPGSPAEKRVSDAKDHDMDESRMTSRRGSVQDSADGDADAEDSGSELSDLDDMDDDKKQMLAEFEDAQQPGHHGDGDGDSDEDGDDAGQDDKNPGKEDDGEGDDEDEEMQDAEDEVEIQDSQDVVNKQSADEEFHEAREENTDMVE